MYQPATHSREKKKKKKKKKQFQNPGNLVIEREREREREREIPPVFERCQIRDLNEMFITKRRRNLRAQKEKKGCVCIYVVCVL